MVSLVRPVRVACVLLRCEVADVLHATAVVTVSWPMEAVSSRCHRISQRLQSLSCSTASSLETSSLSLRAISNIVITTVLWLVPPGPSLVEDSLRVFLRLQASRQRVQAASHRGPGCYEDSLTSFRLAKEISGSR
jgi:hypothetical protein